MNSNHEAMLYGVIRHLENNANGGTVFLDEIQQSINDLYTVINENAPSSSSANASNMGEVDITNNMIYKFNDYFPKVGNNFPKGAA